MDMLHTPPRHLALSAELRNIIHERNILTTKTRMKVLSALDDITKVSEEEKRNHLRDQAIQEILTSEVAYLKQLELLMKHFMEPIQSKNIACDGIYSSLFGHVETIYKVNGELLNELKANPDGVAEAFFKLAPFFKLYSVYAYDYKQVLSLLQEMPKKYPQLYKFISEQELQPEVNMKLSALLITPIQRIPRYRLLLQEVLSLTSPTFRDYQNLRASLLEVEKAAKHIDALVREHDDIETMVRLQGRLSNQRPKIIKPGRKLLKEGVLMKVSSNGKKAFPRHFLLFNDMLMYCKLVKSNPNESNSLHCCYILPLKKCIVQEILSKGMFKLSCHNETFLLYCDSVEDGEVWINTLKTAICKYHESRQTLRKDSSSRRPIRQPMTTWDNEECCPSPRFRRKRKHSQSMSDDDGLSDRDTAGCLPYLKSQYFGKTTHLKSPSKRKRDENSENTQTNLVGTWSPKDVLYPLREISKNCIQPLKRSAVRTSTQTCRIENAEKSVDSRPWHERSIVSVRNFLFSFGRTIQDFVSSRI